MSVKIGRVKSMQNSVGTAAANREEKITCPAAFLAEASSFRPKNCAQTTVPLAARDIITVTITLLIVSTSDTPERASGPTFDTINVSAIPMKALKTCSIIRGMSSLRRSLLLYKRRPP